MLTLACVLTAWEESTSVDTWRHPTDWDTRIKTALVAWDYTASEVENLADRSDQNGEDPDAPSDPDDPTSTDRPTDPDGTAA